MYLPPHASAYKMYTRNFDLHHWKIMVVAWPLWGGRRKRTRAFPTRGGWFLFPRSALDVHAYKRIWGISVHVSHRISHGVCGSYGNGYPGYGLRLRAADSATTRLHLNDGNYPGWNRVEGNGGRGRDISRNFAHEIAVIAIVFVPWPMASLISQSTVSWNVSLASFNDH